MNTHLKEKNIKAAMIGHAVGDALGVPYEFSEREWCDSDPATDMVGYKCYPFPEGTWSDDTGMSLATLDTLADGDIDYEIIMQNFLKWLNYDHYSARGETFDVGITCQLAISNYINHEYSDVKDCGLGAEKSNGNGSLMRIHPMSLYLYYTQDEPEKHLAAIHDLSSLTHAHTRSKMACGIYSFVLWELLKDPTHKSVHNGLEKSKKYSEGESEAAHYSRLLDKIGPAPHTVSRNEIKSSGYVVDTLEAAIWCLMTTDSYKDCVLKAVNLGSDTDTVAAIAGGLAGVLYGYDDIPRKWRSVLARRDYIEDMCKRAADNWSRG